MPRKKASETVTPTTVAKPLASEKRQGDDRLWCEVCQRGINGWPNENNYEAGDVCPVCLDKYRVRIDKMEISGRLKTFGQIKVEKAKRAEFIKAERERNKLRHVKDAGDLVKEAEDRVREQMKNENAALKQEIEALKDLIKNSGSGSTQK